MPRVEHGRRARRTTPPTTSRCGCPTRPATKPNLAAIRGQTLDAARRPTRRRTRGCTSSARPPTAGGRRRLHADLRRRHDGDGHRPVRRTGAGTAATGAHRDRPAQRAATRATGERRRAVLDLPRPGRQSAAGQARSSRSQLPASTTGAGAQHAVVPDGADARGARTAPSGCRTCRVRTRSRTTTTAPTTTHASTRPRRRRDGWYRAPSRITLDGHGRGRRLGRRADAVPDQRRRRPRLHRAVRLSRPRASTSSSTARSTARATPRRSRRSTLQGRRHAPPTTARLTPRRPRSGRDGWYDSAVTVALGAADGQGSGTDAHRVPDQRRRRWTPYTERVRASDGRRARRRVPLHRRRRQRRGERKTLTVRTSTRTRADHDVLINGARAASRLHRRRAGRVHAHRRRAARAPSARSTASTAGAWTDYARRVRRRAAAGRTASTSARRDAVGNVENFKTADASRSARRDAAGGAAADAARAARRARSPRSSDVGQRGCATLVRAARRAGSTVRVSCQARRPRHAGADGRPRAAAQAARSSEHARSPGGAVRCGDEGRATVTLRPSAKVEGARSRRAKGSITATLTLTPRRARPAARETRRP